ncbi:MAG: UbiX family flavin prenyltransferase [Sphaerochaetaceae bacterium]
MGELVVALTGATGSQYGLRLIERLCWETGITVHLIVSHWAQQVLSAETGHNLEYWLSTFPQEKIQLHGFEDLDASISSGSYPIKAMVVIPCSMGTLGAIAAGLASNLIERAASVALKERRPLILVARETPLSSIHLENMLRLSHAGAMILPPEPTFYHHPQTIIDILDSTVDRVLDALDICQNQTKRWRP